MLIYYDVWIGIAILLLFVSESKSQYFCSDFYNNNGLVPLNLTN